jgi:hypothetical protein
MPAETAVGHCGKCGAPFSAGSGAFCERCGNPIVAPPPVATGYSYPVVPTASVPAAQHKLSRTGLLLIAGGALAAVVIVVTLIAVLARPSTVPCGFYCGPPRVGTRLVSPTVYKNQQFGYSVEYDATVLTPANGNAAGTQFQAANGDGEVDFTAASGSDVNSANQTALTTFPTATFQNIQQIGPVRGAEIGFVNGQGTAYTAQFVPPNGSQAVPVSIVIFSSTQNNVTITVDAFSSQSMDIAVAPYGLAMAQVFDYPVSNTLWKGQ